MRHMALEEYLQARLQRLKEEVAEIDKQLAELQILRKLELSLLRLP